MLEADGLRGEPRNPVSIRRLKDGDAPALERFLARLLATLYAALRGAATRPCAGVLGPSAQADALIAELSLWRNHDFARLLVALMLQTARAQGVAKAILFTDNPPAVNVYEALGFQRCGAYRLAIPKAPVALRS